MHILSFIKYLSKEVIGFLFKAAGGIYIFKLFYSKEPHLIVLNYHNFSLYNNYKFKRGAILETGYRYNFEKQISFYKKHFSACPPDAFFSEKPPKGLNLMLTFDDGYKDNYEIAYPILKENSFPGLFFIVTSIPDTKEWLWHDKLRLLMEQGMVSTEEGETILSGLNSGTPIAPSYYHKIQKEFHKFPVNRRMMNWSEIEKMNQDNFIFGSHTHNHLPLSFLTSEQKKEELKSSINELKKKLDKEIKYFAYPNGLYDQESEDLIQKFNITYAFTTEAGINSKDQLQTRIKRIGVNASDSIGVILLKLLVSSYK